MSKVVTLQAGAGGVYFKNNSVLLVKIEYGRNRGMWMLPGGFVEPGETIEEAAVREFEEETGLKTEISRMIGIRSGAQEVDGNTVSSVYFVFEVNYLSGILQKDDGEIAAIQFWNISDIEQSKEIVELSKEMILSAWNTTNGLYKGKPIQTNTSYKSYEYYIPNT